MKLAKLFKVAGKFLRDDKGISSVEYALLLAFIGAGVAAAALTLGEAVEGKLGDAATTIGTP